MLRIAYLLVVAALRLPVFRIVGDGKAGPDRAVLEGFLSVRAALQARTGRIDAALPAS